MNTIEAIRYFTYFGLIVIGIVVGRITMAIQIEAMKPKKIQQKENK